MYRFYIKSAVQSADCTADCTADYKLNLCIQVYHTNRRPIKSMIGVVMNRLVGMALQALTWYWEVVICKVWITFKPIFHCDTKLLTLVSTPTRKFALAMTTCRYLKTLKLPQMRNMCFPQRKPPTRISGIKVALGPQRNFLRWPCTVHVFCVDFICIWWPKQTQFPAEYGLKTLKYVIPKFGTWHI